MNHLRHPLALIYRMNPGKNACRQYPFFSLEDLKTWGNRHPYRNELVRVFPIVGGKFSPIGSGFFVCPAAEAHEKLQNYMEAA